MHTHSLCDEPGQEDAAIKSLTARDSILHLMNDVIPSKVSRARYTDHEFYHRQQFYGDTFLNCFNICYGMISLILTLVVVQQVHNVR
jgi:hypothetical protein